MRPSAHRSSPTGPTRSRRGREGFPERRADALRAGRDRVEASGGEILGVEERGDEAHGPGPGLEPGTDIVFVHAARGHQLQERHRAEAGLQVGGPSRGGGEDLLELGSRTMGGEHLRRRLGTRHHGHAQFVSGTDHVRIDDGRDEEARPGRDGLLRVLGCEDRASADDQARTPRELADQLAGTWDRERELDDAESACDGRLHRLAGDILVPRSQDGGGLLTSQGLDKRCGFHGQPPAGAASYHHGLEPRLADARRSRT